MRYRVSVKYLLTFVAITIANSAIPVRAQQVPLVPPSQWSINVRFYGTTSMPGRDDLRIHVYTSGKLPVTIDAIQPVYVDESRLISPDSLREERKLSDETSAAIYASARAIIHSHQIGEEPEQRVKDGSSVEITIGSFNKKISAVFDHSSPRESKEFGHLIKLMDLKLSKKHFPDVDDSIENSPVVERPNEVDWSKEVNGIRGRIALRVYKQVNGHLRLHPFLVLENTTESASPITVDIANSSDIAGSNIRIELINSDGTVIPNNRIPVFSGPDREIGKIRLPGNSTIQADLHEPGWIADAEVMLKTPHSAWVIKPKQRGNIFVRAVLTTSSSRESGVWHGEIVTPLTEVNWDN